MQYLSDFEPQVVEAFLEMMAAEGKVPAFPEQQSKGIHENCKIGFACFLSGITWL